MLLLLLSDNYDGLVGFFSCAGRCIGHTFRALLWVKLAYEDNIQPYSWSYTKVDAWYVVWRDAQLHLDKPP